LTYYREFGGAVAVLVFAVAALGSGLVGLTVEHAREQRRRESEPEDPEEPRIHRQKPCRIERPLVERLAKAATSLKEQIQERNWETDLATYQAHFDQAEAFLRENKLTDAFREYCRSMRPLNETLARFRGKGEEFRPLWDKGP
jgi:hypothetical protein